MRVSLSYGRGTVSVEVPDSCRILSGKGGTPLENVTAAVRAGLRRPASGLSLREIIRRKRPSSACIVVSDHTRAVPSEVLLPPVLDALREGGIPREAVTILVATGTHRKTSREEKKELLGEEIVRQYRILDHDCTVAGDLAPLTVAGRRFLINRRYLEAELKILTGLIEPHFMAGFSGGRKAVCPGLAGLETVRVFHGPGFLESPRAAAGILAGNPCHLFATRFAQAAGVDFIVNVTIDRNKQVTGVFCGEMREAFLTGVRQCRRENEVVCAEKFDIVVTSNGGYPLDRDFYQTVKGLVNCLPVLRKGGTILCASECRDGLGSREFRELLSLRHDPDGFLRMIRSPGFFRHDQWEVEELIKVLRAGKVRLFSPLSREDALAGRTEPVEDMQEAVERTLAEYGPSATIAAIPGGPYTLVCGQM